MVLNTYNRLVFEEFTRRSSIVDREKIRKQIEKQLGERLATEDVLYIEARTVGNNILRSWKSIQQQT